MRKCPWTFLVAYYKWPSITQPINSEGIIIHALHCGAHKLRLEVCYNHFVEIWTLYLRRISKISKISKIAKETRPYQVQHLLCIITILKSLSAFSPHLSDCLNQTGRLLLFNPRKQGMWRKVIHWVEPCEAEGKSNGVPWGSIFWPWTQELKILGLESTNPDACDWTTLWQGGKPDWLLNKYFPSTGSLPDRRIQYKQRLLL